MRPKTVSDDQLLDLMLDAFADLGFEATSMRQLCRHLGVSHGMIHERYRSKELAWQAAIDHCYLNLAAELTRVVIVPPAEGSLELLRTLMRTYAATMIEHPALVRIWFQESTIPGPRWDYMWSKYIEPAHRVIADLLTKLQADGTLREGRIQPVYHFLTHYGIGALASHRQLDSLDSGSEPGDRLATAYFAVDVLLDGLAARP